MTIDQAVAKALAQVDVIIAAKRKRYESELIAAAAADFGHDVDQIDELLALHDATMAEWRETLPGQIRAMVTGANLQP